MNGIRFGREVRWLFQTALLMFLITIGLGMARGLGLIDFENRNQSLTHLHSGTIGWVTSASLRQSCGCTVAERHVAPVMASSRRPR